MSPTSALNKAEIAIFAALSFPALYCLFKHGGRGILGWFYVQVFCVIRVVGCALAVSDEHKGKIGVGTTVVSSLGLSPLLLAAFSIVHEARIVRSLRLRKGLEWFIVIQYHLIVAAGIAIIASRASALSSSSSHRKSIDQTLLDVGLAIVDFCWLLLVVWTCFSVRLHPKNESSITYFVNGTKLLYAVLIILPLLAIRLAYATIFYTVHSSTVQHSFALRVCLGVLPEMLAIVVLIGSGILTRNVNKTRT